MILQPRRRVLALPTIGLITPKSPTFILVAIFSAFRGERLITLSLQKNVYRYEAYCRVPDTILAAHTIAVSTLMWLLNGHHIPGQSGV